MTTQTKLTCTCASRYVRDAEHEGDCDLWLIDEYWAGFLGWDWEMECLVPTNLYPAGHECAYVDPTDRLPGYATGPLGEEYEWDEQDLVQQKLAEMDQRDRDIALTTDAFIERMMQRHPQDEDLTWSKGDDGMWKPEVREPAYSTGKLPGSGYDYSGWVSDRHTMTPLTFKDGTTVHGTSLSKRQDRDAPDFGLYLDNGWIPDSLAVMLPWQDYGLPKVSYNFAKYAITEAFEWAKAGAIVEIGCIGAHGRTGTVLACMAVLADPELKSGYDAVDWVRENYCDHAVETSEQEWFVCWFHAQVHGYEAPEKPAFKFKVEPKVEAVTPLTSASTTTVSPTAGPVGDPNRKRGKARRGKRGGKRQQNHRNRMAQGSRR